MSASNFKIKPLARIALIVALAAPLLVWPYIVTRAQKVKDTTANVTKINSRQTSGGTVVTLSADVPLNRAQTWEDGEGVHVVVPYAGKSALQNVPRGVKVRSVGRSLEILLQTKPGTRVTVDPSFNRLNLTVNGGLETGANSGDEKAATLTRRNGRRAASETGQAENAAVAPRAPRTLFGMADGTTQSFSIAPKTERGMGETFSTSHSSSTLAKNATMNTTSSGNVDKNVGAKNAVPVNPESTAPASGTPANAVPAGVTPVQIPATVPTDNGAVSSNAEAAPAAQPDAAASEGFFSSLFSFSGMLILMVVSLLACLLFWWRRKTNSGFVEVDEFGAEKPSLVVVKTETIKTTVTKKEETKGERRNKKRRESDKIVSLAKETQVAPSLTNEAQKQALEAKPAAAMAHGELFGAYRVDQEVGKLVLGQPHRMDVLASRAPDDRRAIETSLIKALTAAESGEDGHRRVRQAMEEYGFVARQSAALLLAQDSYERATAARVLGEIGSSTSLPFLLEGLYDSEAIVRTQAVASLGALKMPAAIGALLDMARRHPEMPATLLSRALSACSLDCFDLGGTFTTAPREPLALGEGMDFTGEITKLEPTGRVEELPVWLEETEELVEAMERLKSTDVEARTAAARQLAQYQVQRSVEALSAMVAGDPEPVVRAAAVSSLGVIDHESVFAAVLISFADESREVRAAAARSLSRLRFDRADAYVRLLETANVETLGNVARACITCGMAAQAIDRLVSDDRRQAYEAFSLLSILAKAGETAPLLIAIEHHADVNVRLATIRLLGLAGQPNVADQLRQLAVRDGLSEKLRTALLEVVYKIDQAQPA
jgi:HEAT repeat protein